MNLQPLIETARTQGWIDRQAALAAGYSTADITEALRRAGA